MIPNVIINRGIIEREISSGKVDYARRMLSFRIYFFHQILHVSILLKYGYNCEVFLNC